MRGCMNDHGAMQVKAPYSQKNIKVDETEGFFFSNGEMTRFKAMYAKGDTKWQEQVLLRKNCSQWHMWAGKGKCMVYMMYLRIWVRLTGNGR